MMLSRLCYIVFIASLCFLTGCASIVGALRDKPIKLDPHSRYWGTWLDDETIETVAEVNISKEFNKKFGNKNRIKVVSFNRKALIIGQVVNDSVKQISTRIVQNVEGVKKVYNELMLDNVISYSTQAKDAWISAQIKSKLLIDKAISSNDVVINTENGIVYLMGVIDVKAADHVVELVKSVSDVKKVVSVFEYLPN